jgi:hypothetical protein
MNILNLNQNTETNYINVVFIMDATGSMATTIGALKPALNQLCKLIPLFATVNLHLIIYRDFDCANDMVYQYHGPFAPTDLAMIERILNVTNATGGGDGPECQKFAFNRLLSDVTGNNIVAFHFTDAPPHSFPFPTTSNKSEHFKEGLSLKVNNFPGDWIILCRIFQERHIPVYTIGAFHVESYPYYALLAGMTGAEVILLNNTQVDTILKATMIVCARALGYNDCDLNGLACVIRLQENSLLPLTENSTEFKNIQPIVIKPTDTQTIEINNIFDVCNRKCLEEKYNKDKSYRDLCFKIFIDLINTGHILSLTYNPLIGTLYRQMCKKTKVVDIEEKRFELTNLMSLTMSKLKTDNLASYHILAKWMEDSFNCMEQINELIMNMDGPMCPFLVLQMADADRMTKKDLVTAIKVPLPFNLRAIYKLVANIMLIEKAPIIMPEVFIPLAVPISLLFEVLSHLMCPGVMVNFKSAIVLALVTLDSNNAILSGKALEYLVENKGKWFDITDSEWHLLGFIKMVFRLHGKYGDILTIEEYNYLLPFLKIGLLKQNNPEINCIVPLRLSSGLKCVNTDHKVKCKLCDQFRSITVMTNNGCGLCLSYVPEVLVELEDHDDSHSYLFDCITCGSRYAVRNTDNLNTKPKCHYCRANAKPYATKIEIPQIRCHVCDINMILPDDTLLQSQLNINTMIDTFMCAICSNNNGVQKTDAYQVRLHELLKINDNLIEYLIGVKTSVNNITSKDSLYSLKGKFVVVTDSVDYNKLVYDDMLVLNSEEILQDLIQKINKGYIEQETCNICYGTFIHTDLYPMCYNSDCKALGCRKCLMEWYSENRPGTRILINRMCCPSCKKIPHKGLAFTNVHLKKLLSQNYKYDYDWHYAWCKQCLKVKELMARECGSDPMDVSDYICEDCMNPGNIKGCPFCGIKTSKSAGCDHIECPKSLGGCGIHWCYRCKDSDVIFSAVDARSVYNHLYDVHGNIYGVDDV